MPWSLFPARDFARFAADWDRLNAAGPAVPFLQSRFIAPLLAEFAQEAVRLAVHRDAPDCAAMAFVIRKSPLAWETWQPSQLPLGPWLMRPGADIATLTASLLRALPGFVLQFGVTQLDPMLVPRPPDAAGLTTFDYIDTGWIALDGSFDEYWEARGRNLRANMRKQRKKLQADDVATELATDTRADQMGSAIACYGMLESAGWKAALGTAIHPDNAQGRFYRAMLERFAEAGDARVYRYRLGERDVAVDLCIASGTTLVVLKTTYDETIRTLSPAFLLREDEMRTLFGEGRIRRVEFYGKLMDWHTHWTRDARTLYHLNRYRWPWLPAAGALWRRMRTRKAVAHSTFENT
jgi:CelD/BcsL family acetyltransferase involved in cellulose biosynthesis